MSRIPVLIAAMAACCATVPAVASAKLPTPRNATIVPGKSIAGVKLDMTMSQVFSKWGATKCPLDTCDWEGAGTPGQNERATVSFVHNKAVQIVIHGAFVGNNLKFKSGILSRWKTSKGIALGSPKRAVAHAYPAAKPNTSTGVGGFDLFAGKRPNLRLTRFSTPGIGASANRLRYIELDWDVCHYSPC